MSLTETEFRKQVVTQLEEIREDQRGIAEQVKEINIILHGSKILGVPALHNQVREIWIAYDRAKWIIGGLGITNLLFIAITIYIQLQG